VVKVDETERYARGYLLVSLHTEHFTQENYLFYVPWKVRGNAKTLAQLILAIDNYF